MHLLPKLVQLNYFLCRPAAGFPAGRAARMDPQLKHRKAMAPLAAIPLRRRSAIPWPL